MRKENQGNDAQTKAVIAHITLEEVNELHDEIVKLKREKKQLENKNEALEAKVERGKRDARFPVALSYSSLLDWFEEILMQLKNRRSSNQDKIVKKIAIVLVDGDDFGSLNKKPYNFKVGNRFFRIAIKEIKSHIKERDLLFRYGGDEFMIILYGRQTKKSVQRAVNRLNQIVITMHRGHETISRTISVAGKLYYFTRKTGPDRLSEIEEELSIAVNKEKERKENLSSNP